MIIIKEVSTWCEVTLPIGDKLDTRGLEDLHWLGAGSSHVPDAFLAAALGQQVKKWPGCLQKLQTIAFCLPPAFWLPPLPAPAAFRAGRTLPLFAGAARFGKRRSWSNAMVSAFPTVIGLMDSCVMTVAHSSGHKVYELHFDFVRMESQTDLSKVVIQLSQAGTVRYHAVLRAVLSNFVELSRVLGPISNVNANTSTSPRCMQE